MTSFISRSPAETKRIGRIVAEELLKSESGRHAAVFALSGELGSGKTTFIQGFAKGIRIKQTLPSPTFLLVRSYAARKGLALYHIDCYRIKNSRGILNLGFRDWIMHPDHIVVIEWADKIKRIIPKDAMRIYFKHGKHKNERKIIIKQ